MKRTLSAARAARAELDQQQRLRYDVGQMHPLKSPRGLCPWHGPHRRPLLMAMCTLLVCGALAADPVLPNRQNAQSWLGRFTAGPENLIFRWDEGLIAELGRITVPVDGEWHETVATFAVRHRLTWNGDDGTVTLEEQHNEGAHWRYLLRLDDGGQRLVKLELRPGSDEEPAVVRIYRRKSEIP